MTLERVASVNARDGRSYGHVDGIYVSDSGYGHYRGKNPTKTVMAQRAYLMDRSQKTLEAFLISRRFLRSRAVGGHESRRGLPTASQGYENPPEIEQKYCRFHLVVLGGKGCDRGVMRLDI